MPTDPSRAEDSSHAQDPQSIQSLFSSIAGRYDLANHLLSGGLDFWWRRKTAHLIRSHHPRVILDLATGSGDLALTLRKTNPKARIVAGDFCHPMLIQAQQKGVENLVVADGMQLPFADRTFDALTVSFGLRNMADYGDAIREMGRVLRPGGMLAVLDFSIPAPPLSKLYRLYLHNLLPTIAGALTGEKDAYRYLGESIEAFPRGASMCRLLHANTFRQASARPLSGGIVTLYSALKNNE